MEIPAVAHTSKPWRIHQIAPDFKLEDVWALPTPGGPDDFPRLVEMFASTNPSKNSGNAASLLWSIRERLGKLLGWDGPGPDVVTPTSSLRNRLPDDLRGNTGPDLPGLPFSPVYLSGNEWVAEIAHGPVHAAMHLGWVADGSGGHCGQMAVLVKPNGLLGEVYMLSIKPFRRLIVYPALMRRFDRRWRASAGGSTVPNP